MRGAASRVEVNCRGGIDWQRLEGIDRDENLADGSIDVATKKALLEGVQYHWLIHRGQHHQVGRRQAIKVRLVKRDGVLRLLWRDTCDTSKHEAT